MRVLRSHRQSDRTRRGIAAVEMALATPGLVLMLLGTIDLGQFVSVGQVVSNSSRVAARKASRFDTKNVSEVQAEVVNYLKNYFPNKTATQLTNATTVTVTNAAGATVSGTGLGAIPDGQKLKVKVVFTYGTVRWVTGIPELNNNSLVVETTARRM